MVDRWRVRSWKREGWWAGRSRGEGEDWRSRWN